MNEKEQDRKYHHNHHCTFPTWLSLLLNNPIRRHFDNSPQKIITIVQMNDSKVVLDYGCGPGFYTVPFAKVAKKVVAVDLQEKMLVKARKYAEKNQVKDKVEFIKTGGSSIPQLEGNSCDVAFMSHVYHEVEDKETVLSEIKRALKLGGKLAIVEHVKKALVGPPVVNFNVLRRDLSRVGFVLPDSQTREISKNVGLLIAESSP